MATRKTTKQATTTPSATDFDFGSLKPVVSEPPKVVRQRKDNPFVAHLRQSKESGTALAVPVPTEELAKRAAGMLDRAAQTLGIGVSKQVRKEGTAYVVTFQARERRQYQPRQK